LPGASPNALDADFCVEALEEALSRYGRREIFNTDQGSQFTSDDFTASVAEAKAGIGSWLEFYNMERQHQSLGYRTPRQIYQEDLWICGRSALPTGCASPASRASSEGGEMLAFAHIPTGTATN
jgi:putative transposase